MSLGAGGRPAWLLARLAGRRCYSHKACSTLRGRCGRGGYRARQHARRRRGSSTRSPPDGRHPHASPLRARIGLGARSCLSHVVQRRCCRRAIPDPLNIPMPKASRRKPGPGDRIISTPTTLMASPTMSSAFSMPATPSQTVGDLGEATRRVHLPPAGRWRCGRPAQRGALAMA